MKWWWRVYGKEELKSKYTEEERAEAKKGVRWTHRCPGDRAWGGGGSSHLHCQSSASAPEPSRQCCLHIHFWGVAGTWGTTWSQMCPHSLPHPCHSQLFPGNKRRCYRYLLFAQHLTRLLPEVSSFFTHLCGSIGAAMLFDGSLEFVWLNTTSLSPSRGVFTLEPEAMLS